MPLNFVLCLNNKGYPLDLTLHKVYQIIPDAAGEEVAMIRIVDDSGEDYLYATSRFVPIELPPEVAARFPVDSDAQ